MSTWPDRDGRRSYVLLHVTVMVDGNQDNRTAVEAEHDMSVFQIPIQKLSTWPGTRRNKFLCYKV